MIWARELIEILMLKSSLFIANKKCTHILVVFNKKNRRCKIIIQHILFIEAIPAYALAWLARATIE